MIACVCTHEREEQEGNSARSIKASVCVGNCPSLCVRVHVCMCVCVGKCGINQSSAVIVGLIVRYVPAGPRGLGV